MLFLKTSVGGVYFEEENKLSNLAASRNQGRSRVAYLCYLFLENLRSVYGIVNINHYRSQIKSTVRFIVQDERMKDDRLGWTDCTLTGSVWHKR